MTRTPHSLHTGRPRQRAPRRMWRVEQRAHRFVDRRKRADKRRARGRTAKDQD